MVATLLTAPAITVATRGCEVCQLMASSSRLSPSSTGSPPGPELAAGAFARLRLVEAVGGHLRGEVAA